MSRAFVTESFGWNVCTAENRECRHADLRGACEFQKCVYADTDPDRGDGKE